MAAPAPAAPNAGHKLVMPYFKGIDPSAGEALAFLEQFESYRIMAGYAADNKVTLLTHALVENAKVWYDNEGASQPRIKEDWDTFEEAFKAHFGTTLTVSATLSARNNVKQTKSESVTTFFERCRHIVRLTQKHFVSTRADAIKNHENYAFAIADYKAHVNNVDVMYMFTQGLIPEIRRLILHLSFATVDEVRTHALNAERALRNEGVLRDPNTITTAGHTDVRTGATVFGGTFNNPAAGRHANAVSAYPSASIAGPEHSQDNPDDFGLAAVAGRGTGRGRSSGRGRGGRGRGGRSGGQRPQCTHCKQMGHEEQTCWAKFPHLKPARSNTGTSSRQVNTFHDEPEYMSYLGHGQTSHEQDFHF